MSSTSETGMARILGSYQKLIAEISTMGTAYNPGNPALSITALAAQYNAVKKTFEDVNYVFAPYTVGVDKREASFAKLSKLPTKVRSAAKSLNVGQAAITDMDTIIRQLRGKRKSSGGKKAETQKDGAQEQPKDEISVAQLSYDAKVASLSAFVNLLNNIPAYTPTEQDLMISGIDALVSELEADNNAIAQQGAAVRAARIKRYDALYTPATGLVDTGKAVKEYIKSAFGLKSLQWNQVRSLQFKSRKK